MFYVHLCVGLQIGLKLNKIYFEKHIRYVHRQVFVSVMIWTNKEEIQMYLEVVS